VIREGVVSLAPNSRWRNRSFAQAVSRKHDGRRCERSPYNTGRTADTLADVPPREVGPDLSGHGERSKFVHSPGFRRRDRGSAKSIQAMRSIRKRRSASWSDYHATDLHYERSHSSQSRSGSAAKHRLLVHGHDAQATRVTVR